MDTFLLALSNVLITLFFLIPGYVVRKMKKADPAHLPTLSGVLVYAGTPFLLVSTFMNLEYSPDILLDMLWFFLATLALQILFMLGIYALFRKRFEDIRYRILTIGSVMGNVGFFGLPIVRAIFPEHPEMTCFCAVYMLSMNMLVFTVGVFCLTGERKYISLRASVCNPTVIGFVIALPFFFFGLKEKLPELLTSAITTVANITTPLCMIILGIRLASAPLKKIFSDPIVYLNAAMKLLVFPIFCYFAVFFFPFSEELKSAILILSGTPCAAVILSLSEMHHSDSASAANCLLVSTILSFLTIPVLTLLL